MWCRLEAENHKKTIIWWQNIITGIWDDWKFELTLFWHTIDMHHKQQLHGLSSWVVKTKHISSEHWDEFFFHIIGSIFIMIRCFTKQAKRKKSLHNWYNHNKKIHSIHKKSINQDQSMVGDIQTRQLAVVKVNVWSWSALVTMTTSNHTLPALTNLV